MLAAILLIPGTVALAAPLTPEEIEAKGDSISEQDRIDTMNALYKKANPDKDIPTVLHLDEGATVENGRINLSRWRFNVSSPDGSLTNNLIMDITSSYLTVADDVVFIEEKEAGWFNETGPLPLGGAASTVHGNVELTAGVPVLILETNGDLHGFYAAIDTDGSNLVLGEQMNAYSGLSHAHYKGSGKPQCFVADGNIKYFRELQVDGKPLMEGVKFSSGSTIADITAAAMEKLSVGEHTITFVYMDGAASAKFTVQNTVPPVIPSTGDALHPALWAAATELAAAALGVAAKMRRSAGKGR